MRKLDCFLVILLCVECSPLRAIANSPEPPSASVSADSEPNDLLTLEQVMRELPPGFVLDDRKPDAGHVTVDPDTILGDAIKRMDVRGVQSALSKGANPNRVESLPLVRSSVLRSAVIYGSYLPSDERERETAQRSCLAILKMLFDKGAKIQHVDASILQYPIGAGNADVVALLLSNGADTEGKSEEGLSWIELSEAYAQREIVELLKKHGAKPISPQDAAQLRYLQALRRGSFIQMEKAIREGARVNDGYKTIDVPLCELLRYPFCDCERYAMLLFLLKKGVNPNASSQGTRHARSGSPLHVAIVSTATAFQAASGGRPNQRLEALVLFARLTLEALLEAGAHVASRNLIGETPLHIAAQTNNLVAAELLLKAGSLVMPRDNADKTPLDYAESADMIKLLKDHGATEQ